MIFVFLAEHACAAWAGSGGTHTTHTQHTPNTHNTHNTRCVFRSLVAQIRSTKLSAFRRTVGSRAMPRRRNAVGLPPPPPPRYCRMELASSQGCKARQQGLPLIWDQGAGDVGGYCLLCEIFIKNSYIEQVEAGRQRQLYRKSIKVGRRRRHKLQAAGAVLQAFRTHTLNLKL